MSASILERGKALAQGRGFLDLAIEAQDGQRTAQAGALALSLACVVLGGLTLFFATRPPQAYIMRVGQSGPATAGVVTPEDVRDWTLGCIEPMASHSASRASLRSSFARTAECTHESFRARFELWAIDQQKQAFDRVKRVQFELLDAAVVADPGGRDDRYLVHLFGERSVTHVETTTDPATYCYQVSVGEVEPTDDYPALLAITGLGEEGPCKASDFQARIEHGRLA